MAGTNYIQVGDIDTIHRVVKGAQNKVDIVVVSIHWGPNNRENPTQTFVDFAHAMIDAGIHIIHGHSAHVTQGMNYTP